MGVGEAILALGAGECPASFEQFSVAIDPQWIADALAATDTASVRRRKLPAEHVAWLIIGMGLFRDRSIAEVVHHLELVVPRRSGGHGRVTNAGIVQTRDQVGAAPLAALFTQTATVWTIAAAATVAPWRYLRRSLRRSFRISATAPNEVVESGHSWRIVAGAGMHPYECNCPGYSRVRA